MTKLTPPKIASELSHLETIPFSLLTPFQDKFKKLSQQSYNMLRESLTTYGIFTPFFVWVDSDNTCWINDGHQRHRVFENEGWTDVDVPVIRIAAENPIEAKKRLLIVSSQYGEVTQESWDDFTAVMDTSWLLESVRFDALPNVFQAMTEQVNLDNFFEEVGRQQAEKAEVVKIVLEYSKEEGGKVLDAFALSPMSKEKQVLELLGL